MTQYLKVRMDGKQIFIRKNSELGRWLQDKKSNSKKKKSYEQILTKLYKKAKRTSFDDATLAYTVFEATILHLYPDIQGLDELLAYLRPVILSKIKKQELTDAFLDALVDFLKQ